ncbi:helix-turn-helix domain-containing protein [Novosphingobium sp. BL-52-GroH]|uniref:helix-turn-helix domain-containing protein n=1 Tax=Novosphingobium sp. BL-52-GroH TaxID=3349877 RepID=UPI00384BC786
MVQRRLDCTPLDVINWRMALEARRLLRYTHASVTQVSEQLGFSDPSHFTRFYFRITGNRPASERL